MFKDVPDLEFLLLYRALITERNLTERFGNDREQLQVIKHMLMAYDREAERRYVARITEKMDTGK